MSAPAPTQIPAGGVVSPSMVTLPQRLVPGGPIPGAAIAHFALEVGEYVVFNAADHPIVRTTDPNEAERYRTLMRGRVAFGTDGAS